MTNIDQTTAEFDEAYLAAIKAALTAAGITVHYEEGSLPHDYVDLHLTPVNGDDPTILGWRPQEGGWHVIAHEDGDPDIRRMGLPLLVDPAELVRVLWMYAPDLPQATATGDQPAADAPYDAGDAAPLQSLPGAVAITPAEHVDILGGALDLARRQITDLEQRLATVKQTALDAANLAERLEAERDYLGTERKRQQQQIDEQINLIDRVRALVDELESEGGTGQLDAAYRIREVLDGPATEDGTR